MARARAPGNLPRIVETKTAAYRNGNTVRSAFHKASQHRRTGNHVGSAPGSENAMAPCCNHVLQSLFQIGCRVKGAMKSDFEGVGQFDERASTFNIHGAIGEKYAKNDSGSANSASVLNLVAHGREGGGIVMKALAMGAHHHVNGNPAVADGLLDERMRRCEAVHVKRSAKFYTICAAFLCGKACFHGFSAKLEYDQMAQNTFPRSIDPKANLAPSARSPLTVTNNACTMMMARRLTALWLSGWPSTSVFRPAVNKAMTSERSRSAMCFFVHADRNQCRACGYCLRVLAPQVAGNSTW